MALAVFSRLLAPEEYGRYALVIAAVGLTDVLTLQWLRLGLLRFLASAQVARQALIGTALTTTVRLAAAASAVFAIGLVVIQPDRQVWGLMAAGVAVYWLQAFFDFNQEYARADLAPVRYGAAALTRTLLSLGVGTGLVLLGWGALGLLVGLVVAFAASLLVFGGRLRSSPADFDPLLARRLVAYGAPLAVTAALGFVVSSSDRFLLAILVDASAAGQYAIGYDFAQFTLGMLLMIVNLAAYPLAVRALERQGVEAACEQLRHNFTLLVGIGVPAATGMAIIAPNVTMLLLGTSFQDAAAQIVPWIAFAALLAGIKAFYVDLAFQLGQRTIGQVWVMFAAATTNVLLNVAWIPSFGIEGAVFATVVSYVIALAIGWWLARRVFPLPAPSGATLRVLAATVAMAIAIAPMRAWEGAWALAAQVSLGAAVYVGTIALTSAHPLRARLRARNEPTNQD